MGASSSAARAKGTDERAPAVQLAGTWRAARKDLWKFDENSYGVRAPQFAAEGFEQFVCQVSSDDATFSYSYGSLLSGTGQWFVGDEPDHFIGRSKVTTSAGFAVTCDRECEHRLALLDGDELLEITYTVVFGPAKGLCVTEYFLRAEEVADEDAVTGAA